MVWLLLLLFVDGCPPKPLPIAGFNCVRLIGIFDRSNVLDRRSFLEWSAFGALNVSMPSFASSASTGTFATLRDRSVAALRDAALSLKGGGVGYYAASQFVHIDVGRVRRW